MPEHFDSDIPVSRRKPKDTSLHRNVRRDCWPHYISKQIVQKESFFLAPNYINSDGTVNLEYAKGCKRSGLPPFPALAKPDRHGMHSFYVKYSMNKRKRWEIPDKLASCIVNYQDEIAKLRTSFVQTVIYNTGWKWRYQSTWLKRNKVFDTEFATVKKGEEIHKYATRANRNDLMNEPVPQHRRKGKRPNRRDFSDPEYVNEYSATDAVAHVLYKAATVEWDRRIGNKCDKKVREEKKFSRKGFKKKNFDAKRVYCDDIFDMERYIARDNSHSPSNELEDYQHVETAEYSSSIVLIEPSTKKTKKRRKPKVDISTEYSNWLNESPTSLAIEVEETTSFASEPETTDDGYESDKRERRYVAPLSFFEVALPAGISLHEYVINRYPNAKRVERIIPDIYKVEVSNETICEVGRTRFDGHLVFRIMETGERGEYPTLVRCFMNDSVEDLTEKEARPSSRQQVKLEHINQRKLLPASAFIGVERFDEERCRKELVSQWLTALNMDCYEAVEDQRAPRSVEFCEVCYEDNCFGFSLHCGHYFCNNCWLANADETLFSGSVPIRCMNTNCKAVIELPHALTFLPEAVCKKYEKQLWSKILMGERWICCEDCDAVLRAETSASSTAFFAECPCGSVKCLRCKSKAHHPMPCSIAEQYTNLLECNGEEMEKALDRDSLMLRRCPACKNCCERSDGCNHMTCPCGFEFCYACGEKFDGAHYECEKIVLQRVFLFDVFGGFVDKDLQLLFEENWKFRVMRRPESLRGCRRKLRKVLGHEEADTVEVYSAALETLERSEVTLHFLKKKIEETLGKRSRSSFPSKNALVNKLYTGVNRLQFMLSRFSDEMNSDKKTKLRLTELTCRMEQIIKDLLRSDFG